MELTGAQTEEEKAQEKDLLLYQLLARLRPPAIIRKKETATPEYQIATAFPDPADSRVFWVQPLIHEAALEVETQEGASIDPKVYQPYLRGLKVIAEIPAP